MRALGSVRVVRKHADGAEGDAPLFEYPLPAPGVEGVRAIVAETAVRLLHEAEASRASMGDFLSSHNAVSHVTSTTIPAGLSTEIKLTSEAALPEVVGGFTVERVTATSASVGVDQAELLQQLTDLLDQYAMTPLGLHCLLQIYLARAEGAK